MAKVLLLSIMIGIVALPARAAREKDPQLGLRKALTWVAVFNVLYLISLRFIWHRL
jgi:hypothetical protein